MSAEAQALIEALAKRNKHAATLAMLAAPAVQVEPELLRALRLTIAGADVSAEADLWLSDLVESRTTLSMTLRDDVRQVLLDGFNRASLQVVRPVLDRMHDGIISEILRIEEQVTLAALDEEQDETSINALLAPLIKTLEMHQDPSLARWAIRAFDAAPPAAKATQSMWRLMRSSSVMRAMQTTAPLDAALASLPRRAVRMRLRRDALEVEAARRAKVVVGGTSVDVGKYVAGAVGFLRRFEFEIAEPISLESRGIPQIDTADAFVLFLGNQRSGVPGVSTGASMAELAYRRARERQIPVLAFIDVGTTANAVALDPDLLRFGEEVRRTQVVSTFDSLAALETALERWATHFRKSLLSPDAGTDIAIPDTVPLMLEINDVDRESRRVTFEPGESVRVPLRPRDVTVSTFNGETYALTPELELDHAAIVIGIGHYRGSDGSNPEAKANAHAFREWLVAKDGGRMAADAVAEVSTHDEWVRALELPQRLRRMYLYFAGMAIGFPDGFSLLLEDGTSVDSARYILGERAEQVVIIVDANWGEFAMPSAGFGVHARNDEMIILNDMRHGALTPLILEGLSGRAANDEGKVTTRSLSAYIQRASMRWRISHDFVLCGAVETVATFALPRILLGTEMVIDSQLFHTGEQVTVPLRPGKHELAFPKQHYFRNLTIRPGHNDIDLRWRWNGKWVIVAGTGTRQLRAEERLLCETVARMLADHGFGLFVGSWRGVDELAAQVFTERVDLLEGGATEVFRQYVHHRSEPQFKAARTVVVEDDYETPLDEAAALIAIGGGEGTYEYAKRAERRQVRVFPIAATGGAAAALAEGVEGEFHIDEVTARDIVLHIIERL